MFFVLIFLESSCAHKGLSAWVFINPQVKHKALVPDLKGLIETTKEENKKGNKPIVLPKKTK